MIRKLLIALPALLLAAGLTMADKKDRGFTTISNGKDFKGWKASENKDSWKMKDGAFLPPDVYSYKILYTTNLGVENIEKHEDDLLQYAISELSKISGIQFIGEAKKRAALVSFNIKGLHSYDIGVLLDKMGIAIRTGHHCAQPIMEHYKIPGTARMSFAIYNTKQEIDSCITAIKKAQKMLT